MLTKCSRFPIMFLLLLGLNLSALVPVWAAPDSVVTVGAVTGQLMVRKKGSNNLVRLRSGQSLYVGDVVSTGKESRASLIFPDGAQTRLNANSVVEVVPPKPQRSGNISLFRVIVGQVWARLRPNNAVETRTAVLGVRGTEILVDVAEDGATTLTVTDGSVDFYNDFGSVTVDKDQQSVARVGTPPTAPITVQNAGFFVEWTLDLDRAVTPREPYFQTLDRKAAAAQAAKLKVNLTDEVASHGAYGDALFDSGQYEEAAAQYAAAANLNASSTKFVLRQGSALLEAGQLEEAKEKFSLALNNRSPLVESETAALKAVVESPTEIPELPKAWTEASSAPAWSGLAAVALAHDRPEIAEKLAKLSIASDQNLAAPQITLGVALLRQPGKSNEAIEQLKAAATAENGTLAYQAHAWLGLAYLAQDDRISALTEARQAVDLAPQSGLAHGQLALVDFYSGRGSAAQSEAETALRLNSDSIAAKVTLGQIALANGDVDRANYLAAQAVALDPDLPQARYLLGVSDAGRRDNKHAVRELNAAIRLAPDFLAARSALARVYTTEGRPGEAEKLLTDVLPRYRASDAVQGALGELYYQQARYPESAAAYKAALEKNPRSALYNAELARTLLYSNHLQEAIVAGKKAVLLANNVGQYHAILGQAYEFASLPTQAEREYRIARNLDPRNSLALAQLAFRHTGTDLRPAEAGFVQSFLEDPGVGKQLVRGGVDTQVTGTIGSRGQKNLDVIHDLTALDGNLHTFGVVNLANSDGYRPNSRTRDLNVSDRITYSASPHTNLYANVGYARNKDGLPGAEDTPVLDDQSKFKYYQAQVAVRHRFGNDNYLWTGLFGNRSRNNTSNPDLGSFFDVGTGFPITNQAFTSKALEPELRLDLSLSRKPGHSGILTFGAAQNSTKFRSDRDLVMTPLVSGAAEFAQDADGYMGYSQLTQQFGQRFSLIGQLRVQRIARDTSATLIPPAGAPSTTTSSAGRTYTLPSLLATFLADRRTTVRLAYNQRVTDVTASVFAPTETLITTEAGTLPIGIPQTLRTAQLELERNVSERGFAKVFAFRTTANDLQIGFSDLLGFGNGLPAAQAPGLNLSKWKGTGVGARYEQQLGRYFFTNFGAVLRHTTGFSSGGIGTSFDGDQAPYEPKFVANADLNYRDDHGRKAGIRLRHTGSFFQDSPLTLGRSRFGSQTYVDLSLAREFSVRSELFLNVLNLFDRSQIAFNGYPIGQRQISLGYTQRF